MRCSVSEIRNVHERRLPHPVDAVGALLDGLATRDDRLWPCWRWPAQRFDRPVAPGATGGHGPIRYTVTAYEPGRSVRYRFTAPRGLDGEHRFELDADGEAATVLRHVVQARAHGTMRVAWPLLWGPLHDALTEDGLDLAEASLAGKAVPAPRAPRPLGRWVRLLRRLVR